MEYACTIRPTPTDATEKAVFAAIEQLISSEGKADKMEVVRRVHENGVPKNAVVGSVQRLTLKKQIEENANGELAIVPIDSC